jgi:hypothetical protein
VTQLLPKGAAKRCSLSNLKKLNPLIFFWISTKAPSRLLGALWVGFSGLGLAVVLPVGSRYPENLYVRNALFSQVFDTSHIRSDDELNALLARKLRFDPPHLKPRSVLAHQNWPALIGWSCRLKGPSVGCQAIIPRPA